MRPRSGEGKVALPKYVSKQKNRVGREYYLYRRGRCTKNAWPTLRLPHHDDHFEFALRCSQYSRLTMIDGKWDYVCPSGKKHQITAPNPKNIEGFWQTLDNCDDKGKRLLAYDGKTFYALINQFKQSNKYQNLAPKTQKDYESYFEMI